MVSVLIVAARDDWPTDKVVQELSRRDANVFRMDAADFPDQLSLSGHISNQMPWRGHLTSPDRRISIGNVDAVYYRSPNTFPGPRGTTEAARLWSIAQARAGLGGVITALDCRWVSHPTAMAAAEYKPLQLAVARQSRLAIPPTLITNRAHDVRRWMRRSSGSVVAKPLSTPMISDGSEVKLLYTQFLTQSDLDDLSGVEATAHLFQQWVPKSHEVRLTVAGDQLFAAAVYAESDAAVIDWRSDYRNLHYETTTVPQDVANAVRRLMAQLGLRFGALDFVVTPHGDWVFLEVNPCGQWDWIQHETGLPIVEAIVDELLGGPT